MLRLFFLFPWFVPFPFIHGSSPFFPDADLSFSCHCMVKMLNTMSCLVPICLPHEGSWNSWDSTLSDCGEVAYRLLITNAFNTALLEFPCSLCDLLCACISRSQVDALYEQFAVCLRSTHLNANKDPQLPCTQFVLQNYSFRNIQ